MESQLPHRTAEALADLGRLLAQTLDRDLVARRIADGARVLLDAQAAWVYRFDTDAGLLSVLAAAGDAEPLAAGAALRDDQCPAALAARECRPVVTRDVLEDERIELTTEARAMLARGTSRAILAVPMVVQDRVIGVLVVGDHAGRPFSAEETRLAHAFADTAAVAFENARLYEEAERRRGQAEEAERRSTFLAEASRVLASSLDYETTLAQVARLVVPGLADLCTVDVLEENGGIRRLAAAYVDPANVELARELPGHDVDLGAHGLAKVLRTGQSEFHSEVTDDVLDTIATDPEHHAALRGLGLRSIMVVPLNARGRRLGAITFCSAESDRRYSGADLAFAEDLAGRAAQAIDNARLYRAAQEASRAKDEFLATVSHELRTPLTAILGWARVLRSRAPDPATIGDALETIERNARAQAQIINDLLDVSRIITGMLRLNVRPLDLVVVIGEAVAALRPAIDAKALELVTNLEPSAAPFVGDPDRLQQVVWNLLSNAVKFTPAGGRIVVRLKRAAAQAEIAVRDTGLGITAEFLPYVFDRFRQAESVSSRSHSGLGLGLAIVRHIVELHGGTVRAESGGPGRGATFIVSLPVAAALLVPAGVQGQEGARVTRESRLPGTHVLVVDDDADARDLLAMILRAADATVTTASSAGEALATLHRRSVHVLVCDIAMSGEDGYALIRRVRAGEGSPDLPAIAVTAYARREDRDRALAAGFDQHMAKPVEPSELVSAVASLAHRKAA